MRIGLMVGSDKERSRADRLAGLLDDGKAAESDGFASFWIPQVPGYLDAMTAVALLGQVTERIEIGTAVVPIQTRHPLIMAQQALTTQVACSGRFTLGIGPSHHWIISDQLGLPYDRPARLVRDYLDVLDAAFAGPGPVAVDNDNFRVHSPVDVTEAFDMPVLVAALGPDDAADRRRAHRRNHPVDGGRTGDRRLRGPAHHRGGERGRTHRNPRRGRRSRRALFGRARSTSARAYASEVLGHADFSPNYVRLLEHGDAEDVGDTMAAGDESTVLARLRRYRDAGVTDLAVRVVPLGQRRAANAARHGAALRSSSRRWFRSSLLAHRRP